MFQDGLVKIIQTFIYSSFSTRQRSLTAQIKVEEAS